MLRKTILFLLFILLTAPFVQAQMQLTLDGNRSMVLREFEAILVEDDGEVAVQMMLHRRGTEDQESLKKGDKILMMNGKRFENIADLKTIFENLEDGTEIKIGVERGAEKFILRANKGDFSEAMAGQRVQVSGAGASGATVVASLGVVLVQEEDKVKIEQVIDMLLDSSLKAQGDVVGYFITKLNGEAVSDPAELNKQIEALEVGAEYTITLANESDSVDVKVTKKATPAVRVSQG